MSIVDIFAVGEGSADYVQDVGRIRTDWIFHQDHPPLSNLFRAAYSNIPYYNNIVLNKYNINYLSNRGSGQKVSQQPQIFIVNKIMLSLFVLVLLPFVNAQWWSQRQMTAERKGMWVLTLDSENEQLEPATTSPSASSTSSSDVTSRSNQDAVSIPAVYFRSDTNFFNLKKAAQPVICADGKVIFVTLDCQLYVLPPATVNNWNSDSISLASDKTLQIPNELFNLAACYDIVLDSQENIYVLRTDVNGFAYINGWIFDGESQLSQFLNGTSGISLQGEFRLLEFFSIGLTWVPSDGNNPSSKGKIWAPLSGLTGVGLSVLDIDSQQVTTISQGPDKEQGMAGGAGFLNGSAYITLFANDGEFLSTVPFMSAWNSDGTNKWNSAAVLSAGVDQPPPLIDVESNRVFAMEHPLASNETHLICINLADGTSCEGYGDTGVVIADVFTLPDGSMYNISWIYSGAALVGTNNVVTRLFYSVTLKVDLSTIPPAEPTGCIIAIDPEYGTEVDSYCIPRDETTFYAFFNYLATAPLVAKNARGFGKHTVYVALGDLTILGFDPMNLSSGPLFTVLPSSDRTSGGNSLPTGLTSTLPSDFLAMDPFGTLLMTYWDDYVGGGTAFGVIAVPKINTYPTPFPSPSPSPSNSPTPSRTSRPRPFSPVPEPTPSLQPGANSAVDSSGGLSPGASAAVSVIVIGLVGVVAYQVYLAGSLMGGVERITNGVKSAVLGGKGGRPSYSYSQYATSTAATTPLKYTSGSGAIYAGGFQSSSAGPGPTQL